MACGQQRPDRSALLRPPLPAVQTGGCSLSGGAPPLTPTPAPQEAEVSVYKQVRKKGEGG